jgi:4-hydroxy-3-methylbut-2-en-1-yl diphosphate reductase
MPGHPEVEGTIGQFDTSYGGASTWSRRSRTCGASRSNPDHLAFVTQTTLSVDDTASIVEALRARFPGPEGAGQGGHLLRHPESPGRGQGPDRTAATCWWWSARIELQLEPAARNGRQGGNPATWSTDPSFCIASGSTAQDRRSDGRRLGARDSGAGRHRAAAQWGGEVVEELKGREEHVIFALPKDACARSTSGRQPFVGGSTG